MLSGTRAGGVERMVNKRSDQEPKATVTGYLWLLAPASGLVIGAGLGAAADSLGVGIGVGLVVGAVAGFVLYRRLRGTKTIESRPTFHIIPGHGVGPIEFGMSRGEVYAALEAIPGARDGYSSRDTMDYFFNAGLEVEYDDRGRVQFVGTQYHPGCGCVFELEGIDPFDTPAPELFDILAGMDGVPGHEFNALEYLFPRIIATLFETEPQYDYVSGGSREIYGQVGVGNAVYLEAVRRIKAGT
jgi:hypothetical protein